MKRVKHELKRWVNQTKGLQKCCFSARWIHRQRRTRSRREKSRLKDFIWWLPGAYCHKGLPLQVLTVKNVAHGNHEFHKPLWCHELRGGAAGLAARKRKQQEQQSTPESGGLAGALTSFLQNWNAQQTNNGQNHAGRQTTNQQTRNEQNLARSLIQILKQCLNQGCSDQQVRNTVLTRLQGGQEQPSLTEVPKRQKVSYYEQNNVFRDPKGWEHWDNWDSWDGWESWELGDSHNWPSVEQSIPQNHPNRKVQHPICAAKFDPLQWTNEAKLATIDSVKKALEEGHSLPGNVVIVRQKESVTDLTRMWAAFGCDLSLTVACADPKAQGPWVSVWWQGGKNLLGRPSHEKLSLTQLGQQDGPKLVQAKKFNLPDTKGPSLVTVRIITQAAYRRFVEGTPKKDTPTTVISEVAKLAGCPAHVLTGGNWDLVSQRHSDFLIGHLRLSAKLGDQLEALSGKRGIFFSVLPTKDRSRAQVTWIQKRQDMNAEAYFLYARQISDKTGRPLALRQGGSSDIGVIGAQPGGVTDPVTPKMFVVRGAPRHWTQQQIETVFLDEQWNKVEVISRRFTRHKFGDPEWFVKATKPKGQEHQNFWHFADDEVCITISQDQYRKPTKGQCEKLKGPKKRWSDPLTQIQITQPLPAPTQLDQSQEEGNEGDRGRSPRRKNADTTKDRKSKAAQPDDSLIAQVPGWSILDLGGAGDCGFRRVARAVADQQQKQVEGPSLEREAARLRHLAVKVVEKSQDMQEAWVPDPNETVQQRGGVEKPAATFAEYCNLASAKAFYADGYLLQALATKLQTHIVVWKYTNGVWERYFLQGSQKVSLQGATPDICLCLRDGHFRLLKKPQHDMNAPGNWLQPVDKVMTPWHLRGAGPGSVLSFPESSEVSQKHGVRTVLGLPASSSKEPECSGGRQKAEGSPKSVLSLPASSISKLSLPDSAVERPRRIRGKTSCSILSLPSCSQPSFDRKNIQLSLVTGNNSEPDTNPVSICTTSVPGNSPKGIQKEKGLEDFNDGEAKSLIDGWEVWWICECGFQVLRHPDVVGHRDRRRNRLYRTHKIPSKDIPPFDEENMPKGQDCYIIQVANIFMTKYNLSKWKDRRDLVYEPIRKYRRWFCNQCTRKLEFSELESACTGASQKTTTVDVTNANNCVLRGGVKP